MAFARSKRLQAPRAALEAVSRLRGCIVFRNGGSRATMEALDAGGTSPDCTEGLFTVKSFLNGLERRFFDDLMLLSTEKHQHIGVDVFAKPRIIDVLDAAQVGQKFREALHAAEREKLYSGHCDFVVQRRDNWRLCIVEADGPRHFDNGDTILRDTTLFQLATKAN